MKEVLGAAELDQLFRAARTHNQWEDRPVSDQLLRELYTLTKMGPTSMNCCPMRLVFVKSSAAKERLKPCLAPGNVEKTMRAPVTAIIASDSRFFEHLPHLFPHYAAGRSMFEDDPELAASTAFRNATLQGGYLILAARALGLDVGPMSGFDAAKLEQAFFPDGRLRANFLANLGYGDPCGLYPRGPRLDFDLVARIL